MWRWLKVLEKSIRDKNSLIWNYGWLIIKTQKTIVKKQVTRSYKKHVKIAKILHKTYLKIHIRKAIKRIGVTLRRKTIFILLIFYYFFVCLIVIKAQVHNINILIGSIEWSELCVSWSSWEAWYISNILNSCCHHNQSLKSKTEATVWYCSISSQV
jgi:hypothetical protein